MKSGRLILGMTIPGLILSLLVGAALGTGGYTVRYGEAFSYMSNDPETCVNCHIMREHLDGWARSSHHAVATCNDCHTPHDLVGKYLVKAENGVWHSKSFTLQDYRDPLVIRPKNSLVLQGSCVHCHKEFVNDILEHGRFSLATNDDGRAGSCVHCHASVGHGPTR